MLLGPRPGVTFWSRHPTITNINILQSFSKIAKQLLFEILIKAKGRIDSSG
jgi:hypothetical protein